MSYVDWTSQLARDGSVSRLGGAGVPRVWQYGGAAAPS
jgi:hypothetical protein